MATSRRVLLIFAFFVMCSSGTKFKEHCFDISRDVLDCVLYCFSETTYDVITLLTKNVNISKTKKRYCKKKYAILFK